MITELGVALIELSEIVPDGVVVFFPSYGYLDSVLKNWKQACAKHGGKVGEKTIWQELEKRKKVFLEPKSSGKVDTKAATPHEAGTVSTNTTDRSTGMNNKLDMLLSAYSSHIHDRPPIDPSVPLEHQPAGYNGALLLAVMNGSLSEGINFSDRLGRCVVVVGLPFPNASSAAWKAKLEYVGTKAVIASKMAEDAEHTSEGELKSKGLKENSQVQARTQNMPSAQKATIATNASRAYYTNACMRSVNQSIGRAIRHANDYGTILLFDARWTKKEGGRGQELRGLLPNWIRESLVVLDEEERLTSNSQKTQRWRSTAERLTSFFKGKRIG